MHFILNPAIVIAALLTLAPYLAAAFFANRMRPSLPADAQPPALPFPAAQISCSALLCLPYLLVASSAGIFRWPWLALYALLPVLICTLAWQARLADPAQRGNWRDFLVLSVLGLAVDLRWFEPAWPPHFGVFNKILLLNAGIYAFLLFRQLDGVGFDLRLRGRDLVIGLRECAYYAPIAIAIGLKIAFLHLHPAWPPLPRLAAAWPLTFLFIAVPEELFFRGWLQNLLERRLGPLPALLLTSALFGLAHFNKRSAHFNWRYVLLAALAGIFYGRAWRAQHRVAASAVTHATVDTIWSFWLL
jgi:uncharacterized protein